MCFEVPATITFGPTLVGTRNKALVTIYRYQRLNSEELVPWSLFQVLDGR